MRGRCYGPALCTERPFSSNKFDRKNARLQTRCNCAEYLLSYSGMKGMLSPCGIYSSWKLKRRSFSANSQQRKNMLIKSFREGVARCMAWQKDCQDLFTSTYDGPDCPSRSPQLLDSWRRSSWGAKDKYQRGSVAENKKRLKRHFKKCGVLYPWSDKKIAWVFFQNHTTSMDPCTARK